MGKFVHLQFATDERWRSFLTVDVLQNVAVTLLGLQALIALTRTPRQFAAVCAGLAVAIAGTTPIVHGIDWTGWLPLWLASYMSHGTGSLFPLFPWAGFTLLGATFGVTAAPWATRDHLQPLARGLFLTRRRAGHRRRRCSVNTAGSSTGSTTGGGPARCRSCSDSDRCCC